MAEADHRNFEFGEYRLLTEDGTLWSGDERIQVTQKALELLTVLLENPGRVVSRDEITERLWPETFVDENNLSVTVSMLRKAFGVQAAELIETIPRKGYRLNAEVAVSSNSAMVIEREFTRTAIEKIQIDDPETSRAIAQLKARSNRQGYVLGFVVLCLISIISLIVWGVSRDSTFTFLRSDKRQIAVLPLRDLSQSQTSKQLGLGLTDALITKLSGLKDLTVRPTSSVLDFADKQFTPESIGRAMKVDTYLDGTIQQEGGRIRVYVQLVQVSNGEVVWADTIDESESDLIQLQDSISRKVFSGLRIELSSGQKELLARRESTVPEANALYIKARFFWNKRNSENIKKSIELFEQAVEKDPSFALGFVGVADAYQNMSEYGGIDRKLAMEKARAAIIRAIELNSELGEAYCSLGYLQGFYDWDFAAAEKSFKKAIEFAPNYATAHQWYGELLIAQGRIEESIKRLDRALEIDPVSPIILTDLASFYYVARRYDEAIETANKVEDLTPNFPLAKYFLAFCYAQKGMEVETKRSYYLADKTWLPGLMNTDESIYMSLTLHELYIRRYREVTTPPLSNYLNGYQKAMNAVLAGDNDGAFKWLEVSLTGRDRWFVNLPMDPIWDPLRSDPRFAEILKRGGING